jgi:pimeloyl-ACP methyl ester carboxylesterase
MWRSLILFITLTLINIAPTFGAARETRIPLRDGKLAVGDVSAELLEELCLPADKLSVVRRLGNIDLNNLEGALFIKALNCSLGDGCRISVSKDQLIIHVDTEKLPADFDEARVAARTFTAVAAPEATAAQNRLLGLLLPHGLTDEKPLVILMHGLDSNRTHWSALAALLGEQGYQVAYFSYPSDQPLADSAEMFGKEIIALRDQHPNLRINIVAHSMGGVVARAFIEGDSYAGGIDRLIMLGSPNHGSRWSNFRFALELEEHYYLWKNEPTWSPTWIITDGLGEAGRDLHPDSKFLRELNEKPRREDVHYTIIAGDQHPTVRYGADVLAATADRVPESMRNVWGVRHTRNGIDRAGRKLRSTTGNTDGPVSVDSARLAGVEDLVVLHADHTSLYCPTGGRAPAAWETIRDRLAQ